MVKKTEVGRVLLFLSSVLVCLMTQQHKELHQHNRGSVTQPLHQSAATKNGICKTAALFPRRCCTSGVEGRKVQR